MARVQTSIPIPSSALSSLDGRLIIPANKISNYFYALNDNLVYSFSLDEIGSQRYIHLVTEGEPTFTQSDVNDYFSGTVEPARSTADPAALQMLVMHRVEGSGHNTAIACRLTQPISIPDGDGIASQAWLYQITEAGSTPTTTTVPTKNIRSDNQGFLHVDTTALTSGSSYTIEGSYVYLFASNLANSITLVAPLFTFTAA